VSSPRPSGAGSAGPRLGCRGGGARPSRVLLPGGAGGRCCLAAALADPSHDPVALEPAIFVCPGGGGARPSRALRGPPGAAPPSLTDRGPDHVLAGGVARPPHACEPVLAQGVTRPSGAPTPTRGRPDGRPRTPTPRNFFLRRAAAAGGREGGGDPARPRAAATPRSRGPPLRRRGVARPPPRQRQGG
jgi:hypothetical protein